MFSEEKGGGLATIWDGFQRGVTKHGKAKCLGTRVYEGGPSLLSIYLSIYLYLFSLSAPPFDFPPRGHRSFALSFLNLIGVTLAVRWTAMCDAMRWLAC